MAGRLKKTNRLGKRLVGKDRKRIVPKNSGVPTGRRRQKIIEVKRKEEDKAKEQKVYHHAPQKNEKGAIKNLSRLLDKSKKISDKISGNDEWINWQIENGIDPDYCTLNELGDFLQLIHFEDVVELKGPEIDIYMLQAAEIAVKHYGKEYGEGLFSMMLRRLKDYAEGREARQIHDKERKVKNRKQSLTEVSREKHRELLKERVVWS